MRKQYKSIFDASIEMFAQIEPERIVCWRISIGI